MNVHSAQHLGTSLVTVHFGQAKIRGLFLLNFPVVRSSENFFVEVFRVRFLELKQQKEFEFLYAF